LELRVSDCGKPEFYTSKYRDIGAVAANLGRPSPAVGSILPARPARLIQGLRPAFLNVFVFNAAAVLRIVRWQIRALAGFLLLPKGRLKRKPNNDSEILRSNK